MLCSLLRLSCRKKGTITGNQVPVHFPLFLQARVNIFRNQAQCGSRKDIFCFWSYSPSSLQKYFRVLSVNITLPFLDFYNISTADAPKNNGIWTGSQMPGILPYTVKNFRRFTVKYQASGCQFIYRYFYGVCPSNILWEPRYGSVTLTDRTQKYL